MTYPTSVRTTLRRLLVAGAFFAAIGPLVADTSQEKEKEQEKEMMQAPPAVTQEQPTDATPADLDASSSELRETAIAFNRALAERSREEALKFLADDSVLIESQEPQTGKAEFLKILEPVFEQTHGFTFEAENVTARSARSGEIGYTIEHSTMTYKLPWEKGKLTTRRDHHLTVWVRESVKHPWRIRFYSALVVHPEHGMTSDPRAGILKALTLTKSDLPEQVDATTRIKWDPETLIRAESGELLYVFGRYEARFTKDENEIVGKGYYAAIWERDEREQWVMQAESYSAPTLED